MDLSGSIKMAGEVGRGVGVVIHLDDETLRLVGDDSDLGVWPLSDVGISSQPDGFHLRVEGEEIVLTTSDDARFALEIGIQTPTNRLARQMARLRDRGDQVEPESTLDPASTDEIAYDAPVSRRHRRSRRGLTHFGPLVVVAATVGLIGALLALVGDPVPTMAGGIPAWPAMIGSMIVLTAGGFSAFNIPGDGRVAIGIGVAGGLVTFLLMAGRLAVEMSRPAGGGLLLFAFATVAAGILLTLDTVERLDR